MSGQPDAVTAEEVIASFGDAVDLVLDDGRSKFAQPSSVVRVGDHQLEILRGGVITADNLKRLSSYLLLFVCTGNTCRSPMAETLAKKRIADRLGCTVDQVADRGVCVMSAGTSAMSGGRSASEALRAMAERGLDLSQHESQPMTDQLVRFADCILTMTRGHRDAIVAHWPDAVGRTHLLCGNDHEISDPIGGPVELYRRCADQIDDQLASWIDKLDLHSIVIQSREK
jgi:protein-tyrosine phosphatase